jgi:hypothetical protein
MLDIEGVEEPAESLIVDWGFELKIFTISCLPILFEGNVKSRLRSLSVQESIWDQERSISEVETYGGSCGIRRQMLCNLRLWGFCHSSPQFIGC